VTGAISDEVGKRRNSCRSNIAVRPYGRPADVTEAVDLIGRVCQQWGGARHLLIPSLQDRANRFIRRGTNCYSRASSTKSRASDAIDAELYELPDMQVSWYVPALLTMLRYTNLRKEEWIRAGIWPHAYFAADEVPVPPFHQRPLPNGARSPSFRSRPPIAFMRSRYSKASNGLHWETKRVASPPASAATTLACSDRT
jgi:hypothetical protein